MNHLNDAVRDAIRLLDRGIPIESGSPVHEKLKNELIWLTDRGSDPLIKSVLYLLKKDLSVTLVANLHDFINDDPDLSSEEKTTLHLTVNLKMK